MNGSVGLVGWLVHNIVVCTTCRWTQRLLVVAQCVVEHTSGCPFGWCMLHVIFFSYLSSLLFLSLCIQMLKLSASKNFGKAAI